MAATWDLAPLERAVVEPPSASDVLAAAQAQAAGIREQAFAEGYAAGLEEARDRTAPAADALATAAREVAALRHEAAEAAEAAAVDLALQIAEHALGAALAVQPERVLDVVRGALRRLVERERLVVLVNPEDLDMVRAGIGTLAGELGGIGHVDVQAERRVLRGGAVVRTAEGDVDADLATKLQRAREVLERELAAAA
jgi:flagellar biosynthesis/type III secretory pathway protein FliH